ncbi:MAG: pseudouridine synthase [Lachnospiraceae bacterium]|nr:pseudouridine synthase [Lachnospiraceae bacterium]
MEEIRLNKYLSDAGVCSRREADRQIAAGAVLVDGVVASMGQRIQPTARVTYCGQDVVPVDQKVILMVNKPKGIVCTSEKMEKDNIVDYIHYPIRIYPVGRLDKDSRGLILMTNDGELSNRLLKARYYHEKEYLVTIDRDVTASFVEQMSAGVYIAEEGKKTRPCKVQKQKRNQFTIILTQGWKRQIRRMCEACGARVVDLQRIRIENLYLQDLAEGSYRTLTAEEEAELRRRLWKDR